MVARRVASVRVAAVQSCQSVEGNAGEDESAQRGDWGLQGDTDRSWHLRICCEEWLEWLDLRRDMGIYDSSLPAVQSDPEIVEFGRIPLRLCRWMVSVELVQDCVQRKTKQSKNSRVSYTDGGNMLKPSSRSAYRLYSRPHLMFASES